MGWGLVALHFFGHLKRALELLISVRMSPLATFYDYWVGTITPGEKKQTNKHVSVICFVAYKIPHFCTWEA